MPARAPGRRPSSQVDAALHQVRGEGVAQGVAADAAVQPDPVGGGDHGPGQQPGVDVVAADVARLGVAGAVPGREQVLPAEFLGGAGELLRQRDRQRRAGLPLGLVAVVLLPAPGQVALEVRLQRPGQHYHAVLAALAVADGELVPH